MKSSCRDFLLIVVLNRIKNDIGLYHKDVTLFHSRDVCTLCYTDITWNVLRMRLLIATLVQLYFLQVSMKSIASLNFNPLLCDFEEWS